MGGGRNNPVRALDPKGAREYSLIFQNKVPPSFLKRPLNQDVAQGNSIEFYCSVSGKPVPEITWKKDGYLVLDIFIIRI